MRRKSPFVRGAGDTDLNSAMTPMIDVVFLLLVFFVWTASFAAIEYVLPSEMSQAAGTEQSIDDPDVPPPSDFEDIVVRITVAGDVPSWTLSGQPIDSIDAVSDQLKTLASLDTDAVVILHPDPEVPLEYVIGSYDVAKMAGFGQVSFAVNGQ
jgi:biopolymer transport protein ExbD